MPTIVTLYLTVNPLPKGGSGVPCKQQHNKTESLIYYNQEKMLNNILNTSVAEQ